MNEELESGISEVPGPGALAQGDGDPGTVGDVAGDPPAAEGTGEVAGDPPAAEAEQPAAETQGAPHSGGQ